jgi:hypothetical protein
MRTYKPTYALRILVAAFMIAPGLVLFGFAATGSNPAVTAGIGAPLFLSGAFLYWLAGRASLLVDGNTAVRRGFLGGVVKMRFDEITEYRYSATTVNGVDTVRFSVHAADGRNITVTSNWRDVFEAARQLIEGAEEHGLQDQKARLAAPHIEFGPVAIDGQFLVGKGKRVPFAEIQSVDIPGAWLRVSQEGKLLAAFNVDSGKVPNVFLLLDELRARGVNARDARPWRAVVSVAGFQVPKR